MPGIHTLRELDRGSRNEAKNICSSFSDGRFKLSEAFQNSAVLLRRAALNEVLRSGDDTSRDLFEGMSNENDVEEAIENKHVRLPWPRARRFQ